MDFTNTHRDAGARLVGAPAFPVWKVGSAYPDVQPFPRGPTDRQALSCVCHLDAERARGSWGPEGWGQGSLYSLASPLGPLQGLGKG